MKEIQLTRGKVAIVDDADYEFLSQFKWYATKHRSTYYADRNSSLRHGSHKTIRMHRLVIRAPEGVLVDHIDGNGLNNQRANLRLCTNQQNHYNQTAQRNTSSVYKGVSFNKRRGKWEVGIRVDGRRVHLGYFSNEDDAARRYDEVAREAHGEFARTNFAMPQEAIR